MRRMSSAPATAAAVLAGVCLVGIGTTATVVARREAARRASEAVNDSAVRSRAGMTPTANLLHNGWGITPAGDAVRLEGDMPLSLRPSPDGKFLAAVTAGYNNHGVTLVDVATRKVAQFVPLARAWNGLAWSADSKHLFVSGGNSGLIHVFDVADGKLTLKQSVAPAPVTAAAPKANARRRRRTATAAPAVAPSATAPATEATEEPTTLPTFIAGIAVQPETGKLLVCNEGAHELWIVDPETLQREDAIPVGLHPHTVVLGADSRYAYVSNWGARSVSVVDVKQGTRLLDVRVGVRPNDMALAPDGRLFVACAGDNTVHVIQTRAVEKVEVGASPTRRPPETAREIISTSLYPASPEGSTPDGVAVTPDGKTLYVADADNNAVCVVDIGQPEGSRVAGFIPTGWYPTAVAASPDSGTLIVGVGKGMQTRANWPPPVPGARKLHKGVQFDHPGKLFEGFVSFVPRPDGPTLAAQTAQVQRNSPYTPAAMHVSALKSNGGPVPDIVGAPSPIKYVLYIVKENRTYDQVFGDFKDKSGKPAGNGEPKLTIYGEDVTPNHHQIARDYVLLDNLYCNSEVSVDGHSWCDAAMTTDWRQRSWTMSYSQHGNIPGNADLDDPTAGYLWDHCQRHGVSFKCYGEGAKQVPTVNRGTWKGGRDMNKIEGWITDLKEAEKTGDLPRFMIMSLGEDHTSGTTPGAFIPEAAVGSNDVALGKLLAAASRSKFWKEMAIFIVEDDAQNGPDHIDAHRTVGLVISPYVKRGYVDSTMYTQASMIRTMELILGLPPMTQFDAGATPMFNAFAPKPQIVAYEPLTPKVDLMAKNTPRSPGAQASAQMDFSEYDRIDEDKLNRILWAAAKGPNTPYPAPVRSSVDALTAR